MRGLLRLGTWFLLGANTLGFAQEQPAVKQAQSEVTFRSLPRNLVKDQWTLWTSPKKLRAKDAYWLAPAGIITGSLLASDRYVPKRFVTDASRQDHFRKFSDAGTYAYVGLAGGMYSLGLLARNEHQRETGFLAGQAALNSVVMTEAIKRIAARERPTDDHRGRFLHSGSSFPSAHSAVAWSIASVIAHEYPGPATKTIAYGGAAAVAFSRVAAHDHFPSDVFVGSTLGYLIGRQVYKLHHQPELPGESIGRFVEDESAPVPISASSYVPLDSWVYPAFDRLGALGYVPTLFANLRPWTRHACRRALSEIEDPVPDPAAQSLIDDLRREFMDPEDAAGPPEVELEVESVYGRVLGIAGDPLTSDFYYGSTIRNDFGRPFQEGTNGQAGLDVRGGAGPLAFYVRAEYQHAPSAPPLRLRARVAQTIAYFGNIPVPPATPFAPVDRVRLLDSYVAFGGASWQLTFGKQSIWWGPGEMGPLLGSNNADPTLMIRLDRTTPIKLPSFLGLLGPMRVQTFVGQLGGHHEQLGPNGMTLDYNTPSDPQPFIFGQKISFKPTPNFEFGVTRTGLFGGPGFPVTLNRLRRVMFSFSTSNTTMDDPGDRRTGFDFKYRIPGLRNWLTVYNDSMAEDEINPLGYPHRSAMNPGLYLSKIPKFNRADFRFEAAYTDVPEFRRIGFFYYNLRYLEGYTNEGRLLGNWVGRQGRAYQVSSRYWVSAQTTMQVRYSRLFQVPESGRPGLQQNLSGLLTWKLKHDVEVKGTLQLERWNFPALADSSKSNVSVAVQLTYRPGWNLRIR